MILVDLQSEKLGARPAPWGARPARRLTSSSSRRYVPRSPSRPHLPMSMVWADRAGRCRERPDPLDSPSHRLVTPERSGDGDAASSGLRWTGLRTGKIVLEATIDEFGSARRCDGAENSVRPDPTRLAERPGAHLPGLRGRAPYQPLNPQGRHNGGPRSSRRFGAGLRSSHLRVLLSGSRAGLPSLLAGLRSGFFGVSRANETGASFSALLAGLRSVRTRRGGKPLTHIFPAFVTGLRTDPESPGIGAELRCPELLGLEIH